MKQFSLIKYRQSVIGCFRLGIGENYSVLQDLAVLKDSVSPLNARQEIEKLIVKDVLKKNNQPLYIFCSGDWANFFLKHQCQTIKNKRLPSKLKTIAAISIITRGTNLIFF